MGVFRAKGWWPKSSCLPSKVCLPWVSRGGIWDVPGILPGCPGPVGVFKKFVLKKFVRVFIHICMDMYFKYINLWWAISRGMELDEGGGDGSSK